MNITDHEYWMDKALQQALLARERDEIPVGAVLVKNGELIHVDHNRTRETSNPLAHAEKLIVDKILSQKIKYLYEYSLYVTLEPCIMCAGILIWARLGTLVFGASDAKAGAVGSVYNVLADKSFNHHPLVVRGVMESTCATLLSEFFRQKRQ
ncbi:MAG: tRNA adenosine(34) deaminase TadA [Candidatus Cloacimonadaceae bacterium]|nr:tRNA adenosine(34) deaminase TadA [Candidatus Cloacimonadaceae bacterium]MDP3114335.1 tRNA adenosine(34) deaminase TadA [Candidatus Cloacimonadaceae bacterium]